LINQIESIEGSGYDPPALLFYISFIPFIMFFVGHTVDAQLSIKLLLGVSHIIFVIIALALVEVSTITLAIGFVLWLILLFFEHFIIVRIVPSGDDE
jgi:hypothetical protein